MRVIVKEVKRVLEESYSQNTACAFKMARRANHYATVAHRCSEQCKCMLRAEYLLFADVGGTDHFPIRALYMLLDNICQSIQAVEHLLLYKVYYLTYPLTLDMRYSTSIDLWSFPTTTTFLQVGSINHFLKLSRRT